MYVDKADLKRICQGLLDDFDGVLSWEWDSRFNALLAQFPTVRQEEIRTILGHHHNQEWDQRSIRNAPKRIKTATGGLGDLRANQLLFTSDPDSDVFIFTAWWPWDNGEVVSVRIASPAMGEKDPARQGFSAKFKSFFAMPTY